MLESAGTRISHVVHGVIDVDEPGALAERLVEIDTALEAVIVRNNAPEAIVLTRQ